MKINIKIPTIKRLRFSARFRFRMRRRYIVWKHHLRMRKPLFMQKKTVAVASVVISLVLIGGILLHGGGVTKALSLSLPTTDLTDATMPFNGIALTGGDTLQLQKGNIGSWSPDDGLETLPVQRISDTAIVSGPNKVLYIMAPMTGQCHFLRYDTETREYTNLTRPPVGCGSGLGLEYDESKTLYYLPGNGSDRLFAYDIAQATWKELAPLPTTVGSGSSVIHVKQGSTEYLYVLRGLGSASFWRYSINSNLWTSATSFPALFSVTYGFASAWDGGDLIYTYTGYEGEFKKYSISADAWTTISRASQPYYRSAMLYRNGAIIQLQLNRSNERTFLRSYNPANNTWTDLPTLPIGGNIYDGVVPITYDNERYLYTIAGSEQQANIYRYDFQTNQWDAQTTIDQTLDNTDHMLGMVYDGAQSAYYVGGRAIYSRDRVYKYDLVTRQTTRIGSQFGTNSGWTGTYHNNGLYFMDHEGLTGFQRYDLATNSWVTLANTPAASGYGSGIVNGGDGYLYATFRSSSVFARYNIAANSWQSLTSMNTAASSGSSVDRIGRTIYVMPGNSTGVLLKYNMDTGAWSESKNIPNGKLDHGAFMVSDKNRYLYTGLGTRTDPGNKTFYRYDTQTDTWERMADLPQSTNVGVSAFYDTVRGKVVVNQGFRTPRVFTWTPSSTTYVMNGVWYSKKYDLKQVQTWGQLQATTTGSGATFYTRSSPDGNVWTDWAQVVSGTITSPVNRFIQLRLNLSGDGTTTPTAKGITINYTQEGNAPTLPSTFTAVKDETDTTALVSGQTYEHQHPVFSWSGASDGLNGSGVEGYYVYFGLDSAADPAVDGSFQKETKYTVSTPMTAGDVYYVKLKVKDKLGNTSSAATYFSYRYWYISPPGSVVKTSDADFGAGSNTGVSIQNGAMALTKAQNGAWETGTIDSLPAASRGGTVTVVGDYLYVTRGNSTTEFWRYHLINKTWEVLASVPGNVNDGSAMTYDGANKLYLIAGNSVTNSFYAYDITTNSWSTLPNLPANAVRGTDIAYIGNNTIAIFFGGAKEFYFYDTVDRLFVIKTSYPDSISAAGSGIWYDGNDTIYAYQGWGSWDSINRFTMVAYSIANDYWRQLAQPPMMASYAENNLASDGRGNLYVLSNSYNDSNAQNAKAMKYNIATDSWQMIENYPGQSMYGTMTGDNKRYLYIIPSNYGTETTRMLRYDTWEDRFDPATRSPDGWRRVTWDNGINAWNWRQGNATTATYDGQRYVYAIGADEGNFSRFVRFDVQTGSTVYLPPPYRVGMSGSIIYSNNAIYYQEARSTSNFYKYNLTTKQWTAMASMPTTSYRPGATTMRALVDGSLIAFAGNNKIVYRYTPDAGLGTWTRLADTPSNILHGSAVYDQIAGKVYVISGNNTTSFFAYNIAANTWQTLAALPATSTYGSAMVIYDGKIYAAKGDYTKTAYVYDIAANTWQPGANLPEGFRYGSVMLPISEGTVTSFAGAASSDVWTFHPPADDRGYNGRAVHISEPMQFSGLYAYSGIQAAVQSPSGTGVEFFTRTSDDGVSWNDWSRTTNTKLFNGRLSTIVQSPVKRFIQIKIELSSYDNVYTPSVDSYSLDYYFDVDPPTNPSALQAFSNSTKQTALTNNVWYNYGNPVFDWPNPGEPAGATDGPLGSNVAGYWVYVGTDSTASPKTSGVFVSTTEYSPNLTIPGTYHVRIQAQDATGNVDPAIFAAFIYKFDNQPPSIPSLITVTPSGFTARNKYSFVWPNAFDGHSGIAKYCYHTGATSGPFAVETCQDGREVLDISAAYMPGTNVFYVRTLDDAGNYSAGYITASYYYSTDPPSPVVNLRAIPPTSTQNLFAFTWDLPALFAGDPDLLEYCYSINILPSALNTTCTTNKYIPAIKAATQQGTNIIYMVAKDEAGNVNWNNYAFANFIANTVSPGIPLNVSVSDTSDRNSERWSLTPTWTKPTFEGNGIESYVVERSIDQHAFTVIGRTSTTAFVDLAIEPAITYYYRVRAADGLDNRGAPSAVIAQAAKGAYADPPRLIVDPAVEVGSDQADVTWTTDRDSTSFVYYGTSPTNLNQSKGGLETVAQHTQRLTGLLPSTMYYYRVQSFDNERSYSLEEANSQIYSFKTAPSARIYDVASSDTTYASAVVRWRTSVPTRARVEYGPTLDYSLAVDGGDAYTTDHIVKLEGLESGTEYHYRIAATTSQGSVVFSDDYTLETIARPYIENIRFQPIDNEAHPAVRVSWTTNVPTSSTIKYAALGVRQEESASDLVTEHEIVLRDLAGSTDYSMVLEGRDQYGNAVSSEPQRWQSSVDTRPPAISALGISVTTMQTIGNTKAQLVVAWKTDEPATSQVMYDKAANSRIAQSTPLDVEPTTNHIVIVSGLDLAEIYKIQVVSKDISGNTTTSSATSIVTPDQEQNALDSVLKVLQRIFRF